ncbi:MAG: acyltransferase family protein [Paludibacteraceae bacterium]|nr:acyltransferase family protein [Paludibacteraceae bacterium]
MELRVKQDRYICLDYARIFVAFLVIYGHLYSPDPNNIVRVFIYQFHMPFFFLVSGMLHKYNGTIQIKKYFKTIIVPVFTYSTIFFFFLE